jgi:hypothetical protein
MDASFPILNIKSFLHTTEVVNSSRSSRTNLDLCHPGRRSHLGGQRMVLLDVDESEKLSPFDIEAANHRKVCIGPNGGNINTNDE